MPPPDKPFTIAIIGKQNITSEDWQKVYDKIKSKIDKILKKNPAVNKDFVGYTAMARGVDTIFAEVVTKEFSQPLKIILPFAKEEYRKNFTDSGDLKAFDNWTGRNDIEVEVLHKNLNFDRESKEEAYFQTGKYFIDHCHEVIVVWDNVRPAGKGGTADMLGLLAFRKQSIKDIHIIEFKPSEPDEMYEEINKQKDASDKKAIGLKTTYRHTWVCSVLFGWLAATCFAINAGIHHKTLTPILTIAEFVFVLVIFIIVRTYTKDQHQHLIRQRIKTEKLRLIQIFYSADIPIKHEELTDNNDTELSDLIQRANEEIKSRAYTSSYYSFYCIKKLIEEQINYHQSLLRGKSATRLKVVKVFREIIIELFLLNLLVSFISTMAGLIQDKEFYPHNISVLFGILFSTSFATIETLLFFTEWRTEQTNSGNMLSYLQTRLNHVKYNYDKTTPGNLLKDISIKMLTENKDWEAIIREKPVELKVP